MAQEAIGQTVFVARQPIFDRAKSVAAYELLFRSSEANSYDGTDEDDATLDVIASSFVVIGLDELTNNRRAFINFTRNLLLDDVASLLPPETVTVEILENVEPDQDTLAACRRLKAAGYTLALDDFVLQDSGSAFLDFADIVKVDFIGTSARERKNITKDLLQRGIELLAEKVESNEEFEEAAADGYSYFQGYFFAKPDVQSGKRISGNKFSLLELMADTGKSSVEEIESNIKRDVSLTYNLLRFINSSGIGLKREVSSIKQTLLLLGPKEFRKWVSVVALRAVADDKPSELLVRSLVRARTYELLAPELGLQERASTLGLLGLLSMIDALLDQPIEQIVDKLPLDEQVRLALLRKPCRFTTIRKMVDRYENADWSGYAELAEQLRLDERVLPGICNESLRWVNETFPT